MSSVEDEEEYTFVHEKDKEADFNVQVPVTKDGKVNDSSSDPDEENEENEEKEMPKLESTNSEAWPPSNMCRSNFEIRCHAPQISMWFDNFLC